MYTSENVLPSGPVLHGAIEDLFEIMSRIESKGKSIMEVFALIPHTARMEAIFEATKDKGFNTWLIVMSILFGPSKASRAVLIKHSARYTSTRSVDHKMPLSKVLPRFNHASNEVHSAVGWPSVEDYDEDLGYWAKPLIHELNTLMINSEYGLEPKRVISIIGNHLEPLWHNAGNNNKSLAIAYFAVFMIMDHFNDSYNDDDGEDNSIPDPTHDPSPEKCKECPFNGICPKSEA